MKFDDITKEDLRESAYLIPYNPYKQDEISIIDLWLVLCRRKAILILVFCITVILTIVYTLYQKPVYESQATFQIGNLVGEPIKSAEDVITRLQSIYIVDLPRHTEPYISSIEKKGNLVIVRARGLEYDQTHSLSVSVTSRVIQEHQGIYQKFVEHQLNQIKMLETNASLFQNSINELNKSKQNILNDNPTQAAILELERSHMLLEISKFEEQKNKLIESLFAHNTYPTEIVVSPNSGSKPVNSRTKLYLVLGALLAVALGIFAALIAEFILKARQQISTQRLE